MVREVMVLVWLGRVMVVREGDGVVREVMLVWLGRVMV